MNNDELKLYDVTWWRFSSLRHVRILAEDAVDSANRILNRYGWLRAGNLKVGCQMLVSRSNGSCVLLVSNLVD